MATVAIEPMSSILTQKPVDLASMQIFDMQALLSIQDIQIRALSEYILKNCKISFDVSIGDTEIWCGTVKLANVEFDGLRSTVTFDNHKEIAIVTGYKADGSIGSSTTRIDGNSVITTYNTEVSTFNITVI